MAFTPEQIAEIEQLVDRLKKWQEGKIPRTIKGYNRYTQLLRFVEPQVNVVLMDLSGAMPELMRSIQTKLHELLKEATLVDSLRQEDIEKARLADSDLMRHARDFALTLMRTTKGVDQDTLTLDDTEQAIIKALRDKTLTGERLAADAGFPYNFQFKSSLSGLRKQGILGNKSPGYFLEPEYEFLLKE